MEQFVAERTLYDGEPLNNQYEESPLDGYSIPIHQLQLVYSVPIDFLSGQKWAQPQESVKYDVTFSVKDLRPGSVKSLSSVLC